MKYTEVGRVTDMWDVLADAPTWRKFFSISAWWLLKCRYKPRFSYWLRVVLHAAKTRIKGHHDR